MKINQALFDEGDFKLWLKGKKPETSVGFATDSCHCPLATFLKSKRVKLYPTIGADRSVVYRGRPGRQGSRKYEIEMPQWATDFVNRIDTLAQSRKLAGQLSDIACDITAEVALKVLKFQIVTCEDS